MTREFPGGAGSIDRLRDMGQRLERFERQVVNLIASDNALPRAFTSDPVYAGYMIQEGLTGRRPFAGAGLHDEIEAYAEALACEIFGADVANVQPHSCSQANQAAYHALLQPGDTVLSLGFQAGGHLTHGLRVNFSGRFYDFHHYGLGADGLIDYDALERQADALQPKLIVCGSSSYPRVFDRLRLRAAADSVGAMLMFDLSHEAGLIASGAIENPIPTADVATMSLDKTFRGPFGALILANGEIGQQIGRAVHPGTQSSFSVRRVAESAHAMLLSRTPEFARYGHATCENARRLAGLLSGSGVRLLTDGTDKHYLVADVRSAYGISGADAEARLEQLGILSSRQSLPEDTTGRSADASGLRLGTAWITSRGYRGADIDELAAIILMALSGGGDGHALVSRREALVAKQRADDAWQAA